jgi:hypothetical protein
MNTAGGNQDIKSLIIYGILGLIFFSSGISLVKGQKMPHNNAIFNLDLVSVLKNNTRPINYN